MFLLTSAIHISPFQMPDVLASFVRFGYPAGTLPGIGIVEFACAGST